MNLSPMPHTLRIPIISQTRINHSTPGNLVPKLEPQKEGELAMRNHCRKQPCLATPVLASGTRKCCNSRIYKTNPFSHPFPSVLLTW